MTKSTQVNCAVALLAMASTGAGAQTPVDGVAIARTFLEQLASNPSATKALVTDDAVAVLGDVGGPYAEFLTEVRPKINWLSTCRIGSLVQMPPPEAAPDSDATPPRFRGKDISGVGGIYGCTRPDGSKVEMKVSVILRGERVVMMGLSFPR